MSEKKQPRARCTYTPEFKQQLVDLYRSGKRKCDIVREYDIANSLLDKWIAQLENINIFHTDRGNEFKNQFIEETLDAFDIKRSLSHKGCPYDNAVAEATFKIIKTEFVKNQTFVNLDALKLHLADYVNWFNNHRIHSSLGYLTPVEYRMNNIKKVV